MPQTPAARAAGLRTWRAAACSVFFDHCLLLCVSRVSFRALHAARLCFSPARKWAFRAFAARAAAAAACFLCPASCFLLGRGCSRRRGRCRRPAALRFRLQFSLYSGYRTTALATRTASHRLRRRRKKGAAGGSRGGTGFRQRRSSPLLYASPGRALAHAMPAYMLNIPLPRWHLASPSCAPTFFPYLPSLRVPGARRSKLWAQARSRRRNRRRQTLLSGGCG